ncbi:MAG: Hsp20/alpha crystallin family protein [Planctomycetota bacterium]|nr:MAG: Hsp20/alpha crystallin family protein [Planctomycetota bacterium]
MFKNLIPWKRRSGQISVQRSEPTRMGMEGGFGLPSIRDEFEWMNRMFDDQWLTSRFFNSFPRVWEGLPATNWNWDLGWQDDGQHFVYRAELPGFEPDEFDIKTSGNVLTIRAEHKEEKKQKDGSFYRYGSFVRTLPLPNGIDESHIEANYHSGVLELRVPKSQEAQGKRIEVKSA